MRTINNNKSRHPNSASAQRERLHFTVFVDFTTLVARPSRVNAGRWGEVEVRRHRRPEGLGNWRLVSEAADRMNETRRRKAG